MKNTILFDKIKGCLYGGAIGDALGAPAEWHYPDEIKERYGFITDFVENWDGPAPLVEKPYGYGIDTEVIGSTTTENSESRGTEQ